MWQVLLVALGLSGGAGWHEIQWPYGRDPWPAGRAFACADASCGGEAIVTIRPKSGFCNCATGVSGDDEVDAVADLDMVTDDFVPQAAGEPVTIGWMKGLVRRYRLHPPGGGEVAGAGFALSSTCDLVVAAAHGRDADTAASRRAVADLMQSPPVLTWLRRALGLAPNG